MKVHFEGALEGDKKDFKRIIDLIKSNGFEVVTEHSLQREISEVEKETTEEAELYEKQRASWMKKADIVLIESTISNLGAGFEISSALQLGKPIIVLYRLKPGNTPHVLKGVHDERLQVLSYNDDTLAEVLKLALEYAAEKMDTRFNFFISPKIGNFLDWISKKKKLPRAVYLRRLIEEDMEANKEYSKVS